MQSLQGDMWCRSPAGNSEKCDHIFPSSNAYISFLHNSCLANSDLLCVWVSNLETCSVTPKESIWSIQSPLHWPLSICCKEMLRVSWAAQRTLSAQDSGPCPLFTHLGRLGQPWWPCCEPACLSSPTKANLAIKSSLVPDKQFESAHGGT